MDESILENGDEPQLAAHLVTQRAFYSHHGIYTGDGRVIHYAGLAYRWGRGPVEEVSLERFARGRSLRIQHDRRSFDSREVVARARSRLGERHYRVLTNNCEHFCAWSLRSEISSDQVDRLLRAPRRIAQLNRAIARAVRVWLERTRGAVSRLYQPGVRPRTRPAARSYG